MTEDKLASNPNIQVIDGRKMNDNERMEWEANQFAISLLMPRKFVEREFRKLYPKGYDSFDDVSINTMAEMFDVPVTMMIKRLMQLELVSQSHAR